MPEYCEARLGVCSKKARGFWHSNRSPARARPREYHRRRFPSCPHPPKTGPTGYLEQRRRPISYAAIRGFPQGMTATISVGANAGESTH